VTAPGIKPSPLKRSGEPRVDAALVKPVAAPVPATYEITAEAKGLSAEADELIAKHAAKWPADAATMQKRLGRKQDGQKQDGQKRDWREIARRIVRIEPALLRELAPGG
jgi:hypothetical protein